MPEIPESLYCPVKSFKLYCQHLHPENDYLWQTPNEKSSSNVWYTVGHIGQHTLEKFMPDLSTKCGLSRKYRNHSIRVTGSTILNRGGFLMKQIMSITGHKSTNSLAVYQKVETKMKTSWWDSHWMQHWWTNFPLHQSLQMCMMTGWHSSTHPYLRCWQ